MVPLAWDDNWRHIRLNKRSDDATGLQKKREKESNVSSEKMPVLSSQLGAGPVGVGCERTHLFPRAKKQMCMGEKRYAAGMSLA